MPSHAARIPSAVRRVRSSVLQKTAENGRPCIQEKSALNSFSTLVHGKPELTRMDDGSYICRFDAENSIELLLRIIQCGKSVKVLEPESYRKKLVDMLSGILSMYKST